MPDTERKTIRLNVKSALSGDVGKKRIRLAKSARESLGVGTGESVTVSHKDHSCALTVFKADKDLVGKAACRLDGATRKLLHVALGDEVHVSRDVQSSVAINPVIDPRLYDLVVVEKSAENPFQISPKLVEIARCQTKTCGSSKAKAKALFEWIHKNIQYGGNRPRGIGYRDSVETKLAGEGVCGEMAFLYVAMARVVGLTARFVIVDRDYRNSSVNHACAGVYIKDQLILVDPAYHTFDIHHRKFKALGGF
jgi:transglutaminase-like putative cysteine protease